MNRVLIVDDNAANLYLLRALLQGNGFTVDEASNGSEALDIARRFPPNLIISDLLMPVMDGFTLLKRWKAHPRLRPIHFMVYTATYTDPKDERFALDLGADAFLIKPCDPDLLLERIREVLSRKENGEPAAVPKSGPEAAALAETHAEVLYDKLEKRALQLEQANRDLHEEIEERKRAEEEARASQRRFQELAESIQETFWMTGPDGKRFLYVSPAYGTIWGRSCESLLRDPAGWRDSIHPDDKPRVSAIDAPFSPGGQRDETYRIQRPDGIVRWVRVRSYPVVADGKIARIVGTAEDITDRRILEDRIRQAQKLEAIGQLAAGVAHDFNNILAVISGNVELALGKAGGGNGSLIGYLEEVEKAAERARNLVRQILSSSRQQPLERKVISLGPVVRETVDFLRAVVPRSIAFTLSAPGGDPLVLADATQIHQVVSNLVINSMHALEGKTGSITVRLEGLDLDAEAAGRLSGIKPGKVACLSVADSGNGMDERTLARIFDPFFTTKAPGIGTGLGLAVALGIVQGHDGAIDVSSRTGDGTLFRIYFPAAASVPTQSISAGDAMAQGRHVLFLDDEEAYVSLAKRILETAGCRVDAFCDPAEAVRAFQRASAGFDLVITDLEMPGANGLVVAEEMHRLRPEASIILYTGRLGPDLRERAAMAGIREVLHKPASLEEFTEAIRRCSASA